MVQALNSVWARGGFVGFFQGLIPWVRDLMSKYFSPHHRFLILVQAWIEASTKGGVLLFTASEIESATTSMGMNPATGGLLGGMGGGIAQAYATMGMSSRTGQVPLPG